MQASRPILLLAAALLLPRFPVTAAEPPAAETAPAEAPATNNYRMRPNLIHEFSVPLTPAAKLSVTASKNTPVRIAKAAIAVPFGFNPELPHPILLVTGTSDGDASSIRHMRAYTNAALRLGFVVLAADGPYGKPKSDNPPWRWAMASSLLAHVHKAWPDSDKWPIVVAGFSGGGKWAGVLGAILAHEDYPLIGVFMGGVNQDTASEAARFYHPASRYKETPIFISSGNQDTIATPAHHIEVKENMLAHGFSRVRLETYEGAHQLNETALRTALRWFLNIYARPGLEELESSAPAAESSPGPAEPEFRESPEKPKAAVPDE